MQYLKAISDFFNHPFFVIIGGLTTLVSIIALLLILYFVIKGVLPVWYRLGMGLSKRKIAIFAEEEFYNLKDMLVDSNIFKAENIIRIDKQSIKKAETISLFLVHWKCFQAEIEDILSIKKDSSALIIYAPSAEGRIDNDILEKINLERNSIVVNFRGRLLNDIVTSMITTGYEKK